MITFCLPKIVIFVILYSATNIKESSSDDSKPLLSSTLVQLKSIQEDDGEVKSNSEDIEYSTSIVDNIKNKSPVSFLSEKYDVNKTENTLKGIGINKKQSSFDVGGGVTCSNEERSLGVICNTCSKFVKSKYRYPKNCKEVLRNGNNSSGIYVIFPKYAEAPFPVLCDMEIKGGGWTHIQKRFDGSQDFYLGWRDYKFGFGNLNGEFWLGLQKIHLLSGFESTELLVEIVDRDSVSAFAYYSSFQVGSEPGGYKLERLSGFSGDAGDSLTYHLGSKFSTKDLDFTNSTCPKIYLGAYWYKDCHHSNLNGKYINIDLPEKFKFQGLHWATFRSHEYSHAKSRMLVRPVN